MSCAHAFAGFDGLFPGRGRYNCRKAEDVAGHLDSSAADSPAAVDLVARQPLYTRITPTCTRREKELVTHDQNSDILVWLYLKTIVKRLIGCPKSQTKARRLDEVERLRLVSAAELADELILCIAPLASRGSNIGDVFAWLVKLAVRANLHNSTGAVKANDVKALGSMFVVIWFESAARCCDNEISYPVHRRRLRLGSCSRSD
jgi:hypothetical protein